MAPDLRPCCQRALLDHWAVCDARRTLSAPCACGHVEVLHAIRGNGMRGACSISGGAKAVPCGCSAFEAALARLSPAPAVQDTTDAAPEGIGLNNARAASADTARTPAEANDA